MAAEEAYQDLLLNTQVKLGLISEEELDQRQKEKKKKKQWAEFFFPPLKQGLNTSSDDMLLH